MKKYILLIIYLMTAMSMAAESNILAVDVHSHIVTDEYLKYLDDNDALMEDGYPLPAWNERSHLAFMDSAGIERSVLTLSSPQPWFRNPGYLEEYMKYAMEVGTISLETEPGVLTMYAVADKGNPCNITILETYASQQAYKSHIASEHFQKYKQGTIHMVDSFLLDDTSQSG